jgi:ADP-ribosylglycohydrolase
MDGTLKASSDKNLVFVFEKKIVSDDFNMNLLIVEELLERFFGKHYDVVSTFLEEWEDIKKEFNLKKKTYEYKKEDFDLKEILNSTKNNEITELFGDIIEYS